MHFKYNFLLLVAFCNLYYQSNTAHFWQDGHEINESLDQEDIAAVEILAQKEKKLLFSKFENAASAGNLELIKLLVDRVDSIAHNTALRTATYEAHEEIVKFLLTHGVDINDQANAFGYNCLHVAAIANRINIVKFLLQTPASCADISTIEPLKPTINVNAKDKNESTALMLATYNNRETIAQLLLQAPGIDINAQNKNGTTALMYALEHKFDNIIKYIQDKLMALTAQAVLAIKQNNREMVKAIVKQVGLYSTEGIKILEAAFSANNVKIALDLLRNSKDPQELLARFPFELINPTSDLFKLCLDIAYAQQEGPKKEVFCSFCSTEPCTERCSICRKVYYCSAKCQKADWKTHKASCRLT